jgi:hypothetical protein
LSSFVRMIWSDIGSAPWRGAIRPRLKASADTRFAKLASLPKRN